MGLGQLAAQGLAVRGDWARHVLFRKQSLARKKAKLSFYPCLGSHISASLVPCPEGSTTSPRQCHVLGTKCTNTFSLKPQQTNPCNLCMLDKNKAKQNKKDPFRSSLCKYSPHHLGGFLSPTLCCKRGLLGSYCRQLRSLTISAGFPS